LTPTSFFLLTLLATVLSSAFILFSPSTKASHSLARAFCIFSVAIGSIVLLFVLVNAAGLHLFRYVPVFWFTVLLYRGWLVIGVALAAAFLLLLHAGGLLLPREATRDFLASPWLLKGICASVALSFLATEVGKLSHRAEMQQFFLQSGYPVWFLYFIIVAETVNSIALLFPRTQIPAAFFLAVIMIGAVHTHLHNGDPFSDSLEAVHLLILLACILHSAASTA
jgi:uncharacterized membrane protein YphA (DoxX/SURF4 family)